MHAREILYIIELILWVPQLALAIYVATRQGFHRQLGWFSLILLGTFRLIGAGTGIAAVTNPTSGLIETSEICASVGLISLIGALTGLIFRVHNNMPPAHSLLNTFTARIIHLATMAALVMSVLAGSDFSDTNSPSDIVQGRKFIKIALGLLTGVYVFSGTLALWTRTHQMSHVTAPGEGRLVHACAYALPFIAVRLVYGWLGACLGQDSAFNIFNDDKSAVVARALMQIAMELTVSAIFLWAGCTVPRSIRPAAVHHDLNHGYGNGGLHSTRGGRSAMLQRGFQSVWGGSHAQTQTGLTQKAETQVAEV
jgi:hypothetical protein